MNRQSLDDLLTRLQQAQTELETEFEQRLEEARRRFHFTIHRGRVRFERGFRQLLKGHRTGVWRYVVGAPLRHLATAPLIYGLILPMMLLDLMVTLYQQTCFRAYGIPLVKRSDYIVIDRHQLPYLNAIEKLNCVYCGYGNGLAEYFREVASRTEQFWCPIKHASRPRAGHPRSERFFDYGDAEAYRRGLEQVRKEW